MNALTPVVAGIKLSRMTSQYGIVRAVEDLLMAPGFPHEMETRHGKVATIYMVQGLPYAARITGDPYSKHFPSQADVVQACRNYGIEVTLA